MSVNRTLRSLAALSLPYESLSGEQRLELSLRSRVAVIQGSIDSAPVNPVKLTTDQSGAYGSSEYFAALGYNA